jgi:hypothetical protein
MKTLRLLTMVCAMAGFSSAAMAEIDYSTVINLSGKQRMLTQKMSKEAMLVALDVDKDENLVHLKATRDLFDKTLKGLRNGDDSLGLPPTKKPKILGALDKVDGLWAGFDPAISGIISTGAVDDSQIATIASGSVPLLKAMNKGVKLYESAATGGDMNPALAVAINLAGRQRMLTQKMSKEFLLIAKGHDADANGASLTETIALFDTTLNGLINGDDTTGLSPTPTDEIGAQLAAVQALWTPFKAALESGSTPESIKTVANTNVPLLKEMNKAVGMFAALAQ